MPKPVTMQRVADEAGVSRMTVSLALRNSGSISVATRQRIAEIAEKLGYRPNPLISTLMAARSGGKSESASHPLAILDLSERGDWPGKTLFSQAFYRGICERAAALGFSTDVFRPPRPDASGMAALHRIFHTRNIRGIIVAQGAASNRIPAFPWEHYCCTSLGYSITDPPMHAVASRQYGNALALYEHLHLAGYRRLGLANSLDIEVRTLFHASAALHTHCRTHKETSEIPPLTFLVPEMREVELKKWLKKYRPDVVISNSNLMLWLARCGLKIPKDVGFAILNTHASVEENPSFSGIDIRPWHIGSAAVDMVVSHLHRNDFGLPECPSVLMVTGGFHQGETTRALR